MCQNLNVVPQTSTEYNWLSEVSERRSEEHPTLISPFLYLLAEEQPATWVPGWWKPLWDANSLWPSVEVLPKMPTAERWENLPPLLLRPCLYFMAYPLLFITVLTLELSSVNVTQTLGLSGSVETEAGKSVTHGWVAPSLWPSRPCSGTAQ